MAERIQLIRKGACLPDDATFATLAIDMETIIHVVHKMVRRGGGGRGQVGGEVGG